MEPQPTSLVLLASEQLWPNIHSIEHWGGGLKRVFIYHTADESRSAEPARKLKWFCEQRFENRVPTIEVKLEEGDATPEAVTKQLKAWCAVAPDEQWVVNATGGTKLMYTGVVGLFGRSNVRVVYRELGLKNLWYELARVDGDVTATQINVPATVTDQVPVQLLVRALWETDALPVTFDPTPPPLDVLGLTRELIDTAGKWRQVFGQAGVILRPGDSPGILFERYVAAGLFEMGVTNLICSTKQGEDEKLHEIDLVANHSARVLVFDCKLRTKEEEDRGEVETITSQIRQAAQTVRRVGGSGADVLLLRPNRELSEPLRELAKDLRVQILDRCDLGRFFHRLSTFVGCPALPSPLRQADELLSDPENAIRLFPGKAPARIAEAGKPGTVIELESLLSDWARDHRQDWAITHLRASYYYLQCSKEANLSVAAFRGAIQRVFRSFGEAYDVRTSGSGTTFYVSLDILEPRRSAFRAFLKSRVGKPLLG